MDRDAGKEMEWTEVDPTAEVRKSPEFLECIRSLKDFPEFEAGVAATEGRRGAAANYAPDRDWERDDGALASFLAWRAEVEEAEAKREWVFDYCTLDRVPLFDPFLEELGTEKAKPRFHSKLREVCASKNVEPGVELYRAAGLDRRHFSKLMSQPDYVPGKKTLVALAMALRLDHSETNDLLAWAGYTLSSVLPEDIIVSSFIRKGVYDLLLLDAALVRYGCAPLHKGPREEKKER